MLFSHAVGLCMNFVDSLSIANHVISLVVTVWKHGNEVLCYYSVYVPTCTTSSKTQKAGQSAVINALLNDMNGKKTGKPKLRYQTVCVRVNLKP